jgi:NCS1 family nucleobase:cation symporter-1
MTSTTTARAPVRADAPRTLAELAPTELGLRETFGLWAHLAVSLLLPVAAAFVVLAGRLLGVTVLAIAVGSVIGAVLLGAVFVPLAGVLLVACSLLPHGAWDVSEDAPARPALLLPWAVGFAAYQLTVPTGFVGTGAGWTSWWAARPADLGISATSGLSASLVSLTVASLLTVAVALRARRGTA